MKRTARVLYRLGAILSAALFLFCFAFVAEAQEQHVQRFAAGYHRLSRRSPPDHSGHPELQIIKDLAVSIPQPKRLHGEAVSRIDASAAKVIDLANASALAPKSAADYSFNNAIIRANVLQNSGNSGQGVIVGVIDSGVANNPSVVGSLAGSVIGGETFVQGDTAASATSTRNGLHGTWVANMIAAHAIFLFADDNCLPLSVQKNAPDSVIDGARLGVPGAFGIPLIGVAPAAKLYAFKVFPSDSDSTRTSAVIAAMDRAITLKKNFLAGMTSAPVAGSGTEDDPFVYNSLNIRVLNLSLGGPDLFAGRDAEAILDTQLIDAGIVVSIAAGNAGPSGVTMQSPGDGLAALSMGASVTPTHDRILDDVNACAVRGPVALGTGALDHPTDFDQVAFFSSRGPTPDGRGAVSAITAGTANLAQGADGSLYIVSGTSFSAPTAAGAAALLASAVPSATAKQIRNAILQGAANKSFTAHSNSFDRGGGYLDLVESLKLLQRGDVPDSVPVNLFASSVALNLFFQGIIPELLSPGATVSNEVKNLEAGDRREFFIEIPRNVASLTFNLTDVMLDSADKQNAIFGDDLIVAIHQAKMTGGAGADDYAVGPAVASGPASIAIPNPEPGFLRVTLMGDSTNASRVSAKFKMSATLKPAADSTFAGTIADQGIQFIPFTVPSGLSQATFELTWDNDWTHYPTNDLDLVLIDPSGNLNFDGATLNGRERAVVANPAPGQWQLAVIGASVFGTPPQGDGSTPTAPGKDKFKVEIFLTH